MTGTVIVVVLTYLLMLAAMYWHRVRRFHVSVMAFIIAFDVSMPFYLAATHDWKKRLIDDGGILSVSVWMHFGLIITLYVLYLIQVQAGLKIWRFYKKEAKPEAKKEAKQEQEEEPESLATLHSEHRALSKGVLLVRALVIGTGAALVDSAPVVA